MEGDKPDVTKKTEAQSWTCPKTHMVGCRAKTRSITLFPMMFGLSQTASSNSYESEHRCMHTHTHRLLKTYSYVGLCDSYR